jgi:hypothetical protein
VLAVIHLSKSGTNSPASSSSTPSAGSSATHAAAGSAARYTLTLPAKIGPYLENGTATSTFLPTTEAQDNPSVTALKASGAAHPTQTVFAVYDLGSVTIPGASDFKAISFIGYNGTFNPSAVIKYEQTKLVDWRIVPAGPHGGKMMCGYNRSTGSEASDCLWVTTSTFGQVQFIVGQTTVKYPGAQTYAMEVRAAVEKLVG